jgi:hypothetical protein
MINTENLSELQKIRGIINMIVSLLEENINNIKNFNVKSSVEQKESLNFLIGGKENVVSIITKLGNLLIKLDGTKNNCDDDEIIGMEDIDFELIEKFLMEKKRGTVGKTD